jgi:hypothetical protein
MSIFAKRKPVGLFYADKHSGECLLDDKGYAEFKKLCLLAAKRLEIAQIRRKR